MSSHRLFGLLAVTIGLLNAAPSFGGPLCKPNLSVMNVRISELRNLERTWTAAVRVDASRCSDFAGRSDIHVLREKENAPEVEFKESFTWQAGELGIAQTEASIDLWADEAVHDYRIYPARCACRG
jgi:hypothetical protein